MYCAACGAELLVGEKLCTNCGHPVSDAGMGAKIEEFNMEWLAEALTEAGYRAKVLERDKEKLLVGRAGRMDTIIDVRLKLGLIVFHRSWKVKALERDKRAELLEAVNEDNRMSRLSTFYIDAEADILKAKSQIGLAERLEGIDVVRFVEALETDPPQNVTTAGFLDAS